MASVSLEERVAMLEVELARLKIKVAEELWARRYPPPLVSASSTSFLPPRGTSMRKGVWSGSVYLLGSVSRILAERAKLISLAEGTFIPGGYCFLDTVTR